MKRYYLVNKETGKKYGWHLTLAFAKKCRAHNEKIVCEGLAAPVNA